MESDLFFFKVKIRDLKKMTSCLKAETDKVVKKTSRSPPFLATIYLFSND
jgi:hypothetical protein